MKKFLLSILCFTLIIPTIIAQDDDEETEEEYVIVPNGDFEDTETKKLKTTGMIDEMCRDWFSGTRYSADIFAEGIKSEKVSIPKNQFGVQEAASGSMYAGFTAYTKDAKASRSYLEVKLNEKLKKNQSYCIQYKISLADLSKFGVNNVGVAFSDRKIEQPNTGPIIRDCDVKHRANKVINVTDGWETICGTFVGTGQEEYMVIGCFESDTKVTIEKIKRPRGVTGAQVYHAYYYIDEVTITPIEARSQCQCDPSQSSEPDLVYGGATVINENMTAEQKINATGVYYAFLKRGVTGNAQTSLNKIAEILKENPSWQLEIIGHCGSDETDEGKINSRYRELGEQRAKQVATYLKSKGITEDRLLVLSKEDSDPASTRDTPISKAQNRRVMFSIRK